MGRTIYGGYANGALYMGGRAVGQGQRKLPRYRVDVHGGQWVGVDTLGEASEACCDARDYYGLGASEWTGGEVQDGRTGKVVARVSYNGRVWTPEPWPQCRELTGEELER